MVLCAIIIFGSAAINNGIRARADVEVTDVLNYAVDKKEDSFLDEEKIYITEVEEGNEVEDNVDNI